MARTPLFRMVRALVARSAADTGLDRLRRPVGSAISRRSALRGIGLGAAALAAGPLSWPAQARPRAAPRIAIVGGGIAGLNCALTLLDAGVAATIYEADDRVGGRMKSDRDTWADGHVTEWCGEFIDTGHTTIQALAARFGLALQDLHAAEPAHSTETYFFAGGYYAYSQADRDFQRLVKTLARQNEQAPFPTQWDSYTETGWRLDHLSIRQWIEKYVPGGYASKLGQLLDVAYDIEFGAATPNQSALNLVSLLPGPTDDLSLFGYSDETFRVAGGNDQIPAAIAAALPADRIKLGYALTAIAERGDEGIRLTFATPAGVRTITADQVVLTLPFSILRRLDYARAGFDARKRTAIEQLGYGTNAKLMLELSERYWLRRRKPWGASNGTTYADTGMQAAWDATRAQPGASGILCNYTGSAGAALLPQDDDEETTATSARAAAYARAFLRQVEPVFPGISACYHGVAALSAQTYDPHLGGSYSYWRVGQNTLFGGYEAVRQGNILFAGEHTSTNFQGYMEGGAEQGARAAADILADL